jgi:hypothetical protein
MKKIWTDAMLARRRQGKKKNNTRQDKEKERIKMHYHHLYTNQEEDLIASSSSTRQLDENKHGATKILDQCILQPGIHHTNMAMITWMGQPLRQDKCPFPLHIQWFRALNDHDDFKIIPNAKEEWFTPIADDIGTRLLAKIMLQEENVFKTKMLEYGPIKEDPHVRSHVEHFLEQKTALFMGLLSLQVQAQEENEEEMMDNDEVVLQEPKELKVSSCFL